MRLPFRCLVPGCKTTNEINKDTVFFSLPIPEAILRHWALNINRFDILEKSLAARKNYKICYLHFESTAFQTAEKKKLNRGAMPTLLLPDDFTSTEPSHELITGDFTQLYMKRQI